MNLFGMKKKERSAGLEKEMSGMMDDLLAKAADTMLDERTIESGRKVIEKAMKRDGIEYSAQTLKALKVGAQVMLAAKDDEKGQPVEYFLLMTIAKLAKVESDIEKVKTS